MAAHKMTKNQALVTAQKMWGKKAYIEENSRALSPEGREEARKQLEENKKTIASIEERLKALGPIEVAQKKLMEAAEFVCDVDGDDPSIPQLKEAVAVMNQIRNAKAMLMKAKKEGNELLAKSFTKRFKVGYVDNAIPGFPVAHIHGEGDTWEEAFEKSSK